MRAGGGVPLHVASAIPAMHIGAARLLRWAGVALIALAAVTFDERTAFPGAAAMLPVAGAVLVIAAGAATGGRGWLEHPLMVATGKRSYSWYLWHWPVRVFLPLAVERGAGEADPVAVTVAAVLLSLGAADLSYRFIEDPLRRSRGLKVSLLRTYALGFTSLAVVLLVSRSVAGPGPWEGPRAAVGELQANGADTPVKARADRGGLDDHFDCTLGYRHVEVEHRCQFGDPQGDVSVALVGDSHAAHWAIALHEVAREQGWRLYVSTKAACPATDVPIYETDLKGRYEACEEWRENLRAHLAGIPDLRLVVLGRSQAYPDYLLDESGGFGDRTRAADLWEQGLIRTLRSWQDIVPAVAIVQDTPKAPFDVTTCLSARKHEPGACDFPSAGVWERDDILAFAETRPWERYRLQNESPAHFHILKPGVPICEQETCKVVSDDGVIRYRDEHHLTATYAGQFKEVFREALDPIVQVAAAENRVHEKPLGPVLAETDTTSDAKQD